MPRTAGTVLGGGGGGVALQGHSPNGWQSKSNFSDTMISCLVIQSSNSQLFLLSIYKNQPTVCVLDAMV